MGKEPTPSPPSNYDETRLSVLVQIEKRELDHLRLPLWFFPRRIVGQLQEEQPFIRTERPQFQLRRLIARLDETRIFHALDVFVVLLPLQGVRAASSVS